MNHKNLIDIVKKFKNKKVLIIGDIMLDKYIWGSVSRISPEAPVQVVNVTKESYMPGGAGNAANNIAALGGIPYLIGIVGKDQTSTQLTDLMKSLCINTEGIVTIGTMPTILKIRIFAKSQQLLRVDYENVVPLTKEEEQKIINCCTEKIRESDIVLISDYAKGALTSNIMAAIKNEAEKNNKKIIIDPKPKHKKWYHGCYVLTPNITEAIELTNSEDHDITTLGRMISKEFDTNVILTRSEKGISLFEKNNEQIDIPTKAKEVFDVSGAGDTAVAAIALSLVSGASLHEAATIANYAAGITVGKIGTSTVSQEELEHAILNDT